MIMNTLLIIFAVLALILLAEIQHQLWNIAKQVALFNHKLSEAHLVITESETKSKEKTYNA